VHEKWQAAITGHQRYSEHIIDGIGVKKCQTFCDIINALARTLYTIKASVLILFEFMQQQ
jgi:hypothetical protein